MSDLSTHLGDLRAILARHTRGFATASDATWDHDPICVSCGAPWPCLPTMAFDLAQEAVAAVEKMRSDVHHHLNPAIGWLRGEADRAPISYDPAKVAYTSDGLPDVEHLPPSTEIATGIMVSVVTKMRAALDAVDETSSAADR